jgi:XTP/dITP diphosphohydrolase
MKAVFVTSNRNKLLEARRILGIELQSAELDLQEIQALDVAGVAAAKALAAREALVSSPHPVLVEDSGLVIEAWRGLPGAFTRWFLASVGNEGLLRMLPPDEDRSARAVCVVAVAYPDGGPARTFRGEVRGEISRGVRGEGGFGWDPIFVPEGSSLTYAEMGEDKHRDSHRARAFRSARRWLEMPRTPGKEA